ncbi:Cellulosome-anchoring protein precursor [compost metagenome]
MRAFNLTKQKELRYSDLGKSHWAYTYISQAEQGGLINGYPNQLFAPDRNLTRMEMTSMLAKSMNMAGKLRGNSPFQDVSEDYWGVGLLKQMWADGWVNGFSDGTFRPEKEATRAEFVTLLNKVLKR